MPPPLSPQPTAPAPAGSVLPPRRRARPARGGRWWPALLGLAFVGALLWGGWYLAVRGFSRHWRETLKAEFRRRGLDIVVRRVTLDPFEGLVADDVRLRLLDERRTPLLSISRVALDVNLVDLLRRRPEFLRSVDLRKARLALPVDFADPDGPKLKLRRLQAKVTFLPGQIRLNHLEGDCAGVRLSAAGSLLHPERYAAVFDPAQGAGRDTPAARARRRRLAQGALDALAQFHFDRRRPPQANGRFEGDLARPETIRVAVDLTSAALAWRPPGAPGYQAESLHLRAEYEAGLVRLRELEVADRRGRLAGEGEYRVDRGQVRFRVDTGGADVVPALAGWTTRLGLVPASLPPQLRTEEPPRLRLDGQFGVAAAAESRAADDAAPVPEPPRLTGHLHLGRAHLRDVPLEHLDTDFAWTRGSWYLRDLRLTSRSGQQLSGDLLQEPGGFRARLTSTLQPALLAPYLAARGRAALAEWQFADSPLVELTAAAPSWDNPAQTRLEGQVTLGRGRFRNVAFNRLQTRFAFADQALTCRQLRIERDEGSASADALVYDPGRHECRVDNLRATLSPVECAVWVDPDLTKNLRPYHFARPPQVNATGVVRLEDDPARQTRLNLEVSAPAGMRTTFLGKELHFTRVNAQILYTDNHLQFSNLRGEIFGGELGGNLNLFLPKGARPEYAASVEARGVNFSQLTKLYFGYDDSKGRLEARFDWRGRGDEARSIRGAGSVRVDQGNVLAIPIFGPLSPLLNEFAPGAGFQTAHLANATFAVADGRIVNDNLDVRGTGFSMIGHGWIGFLDDAMNYQVRVNAQGVAGTVLYPVSKLFEYGSQGPLHKPVWRPQVLPRSPLLPPPGRSRSP